jgi:hypothetical protein
LAELPQAARKTKGKKMHNLILVPAIRGLEKISTAVLYARHARAYLKISSAGFNELVRQGVINRYTHVGGKRPFFLKHELDTYLNSLPRYKMDDCELAPNPEEGSSV